MKLIFLLRSRGLCLIVLFFASLSSSSVYSQSTWSVPDPTTGIFYNANTGTKNYIGIGTQNPTAPLHIAYQGFPSLSVGIAGNKSNSVAQILNTLTVIGSNPTDIASNGAVAYNFYNDGNNPSWSGALLQHYGVNLTGTQYGVPTANLGALTFQNLSNAVIGTNGETNLFISLANTISATFLWDGRVGIGTQNPGSFKLAVEGSVGARKMVITQTNPFPDYVFHPGYALPSLRTVEDYIRTHGRLSGLPSADSVAINGLDLGNVQTKTVEKIEELTLYIIKQDKQIDSLQRTIRTQEERISRLEKMMQR